MTAVQRSFKREIGSLRAIFDFTASFFELAKVDPRLQPSVELVVEELFTNMVKYNAGSAAEVRVEMTPVDGGIEVTLTDYDADPFDPTQAPDVDITLPAEQRTPGGLGLHLVRQMVDSLEYRYGDRQSRITFRKTLAGGEEHA